MAKLVLDLHEIYNRSDKIDSELNRIVQEAIAKRIALVEIIPGKGSGQLKKHVLRFLRDFQKINEPQTMLYSKHFAAGGIRWN